ncbi:Hypothetical predicted protein [Lecanosticta acicola]|uniref:Uncharacterized protein n=1 Tax=Lecanosticta acicola TaxID=111012 RepID=A0AAI9EE87_9PEZI|nr:Hypothetical predicted protein [Lecanosticta acicola]
MDSYALVTYRCSHFVIVPTDDDNKLLEDPTKILKDYSSCDNTVEDLFEKPTTQHIKLTDRYCEPECESTTLERHKRQLRAAAFGMRCFLQRSGDEYLQLGIRYHDFPLKLRSWLCDIKRVSTANSQYGIEVRSWREDPFFAPWRNAVQSLDEADKMMRKRSWSGKSSQMNTTTCHVNETRGNVGQVVRLMNEVRAGITKLGNRMPAFEKSQHDANDERAQRREQRLEEKMENLTFLLDSAELKEESRSARNSVKVTKAKRRTWKKDRLQIGGMHLRHAIFARSVKENWVRRMNSFETLFQRHRKLRAGRRPSLGEE